ncbi:hypothetical protein KI387_036911, partial [Taxus chinensis]
EQRVHNRTASAVTFLPIPGLGRERHSILILTEGDIFIEYDMYRGNNKRGQKVVSSSPSSSSASSTMEGETLSRLEQLDWGTVTNIIRCLNEPADVAHFAAASTSCRRIVVESRCVKELCIRMSPEISMCNSVAEDKMGVNESPGFSKDSEWENLKTEHKIYSVLAHELMASPAERSCIYEPICASSTDNYPEETIANTLDPTHIDSDGPRYWSSKGESNTYFQTGDPIYSANAVRFRFGYSSSSPGSNSSTMDRFVSSAQSPCEDYVWTYVSPAYPMQQEDKLQIFKLPRPILCIGGILQVELLGRVQQQDMDRLYYICICHVRVSGRPLSFFNFEVLGQPRKFILKYIQNGECIGVLDDTSKVASEDEVSGTWHSIAERIRQIRAGRVLAMLGNIGVANFIAPNDLDSDDEDIDDNPVIF